MLNKVKLALRINNTAYDDEIIGLINACKRELELAGIASSNIVETDIECHEFVVILISINNSAEFSYLD